MWGVAFSTSSRKCQYSLFDARLPARWFPDGLSWKRLKNLGVGLPAASRCAAFSQVDVNLLP
jgi:hypothetical protein